MTRTIGWALAMSTHCGYTAMSEEFSLFREAKGLEWEHLQQFAVFLHRRVLAPNSVQRKTLALVFQAKALGVHDSRGDFSIKKMIEGWNKEHVRVPDDRTSMTPDILVRFTRLWCTICQDDYKAALFHEVTLIAFLET